MVSDIPEPCEFPSLGSCQKRFIKSHKEVDLAPHPVVDLLLQVSDAGKFVLKQNLRLYIYILTSFTCWRKKNGHLGQDLF